MISIALLHVFAIRISFQTTTGNSIAKLSAVWRMRPRTIKPQTNLTQRNLSGSTLQLGYQVSRLKLILLSGICCFEFFFMCHHFIDSHDSTATKNRMLKTMNSLDWKNSHLQSCSIQYTCTSCTAIKTITPDAITATTHTASTIAFAWSRLITNGLPFTVVFVLPNRDQY